MPVEGVSWDPGGGGSQEGSQEGPRGVLGESQGIPKAGSQKKPRRVPVLPPSSSWVPVGGGWVLLTQCSWSWRGVVVVGGVFNPGGLGCPFPRPLPNWKL